MIARRHRRVVAALLLYAGATSIVAHRSAAAVPTQDVERSRREAFLRNASVVGIQTVDLGITLPQRLELELDGQLRSAMFKSVEVEHPGRIRVASETQNGLRDSWKFEVAAYELDRLLGLGLVPVTVVRTIEGVEGAVIDWVDDVLPDLGVSPHGFDAGAWDDTVARVWLFDYLAYNIDRTPENLLLTPGFGVRLIDHTRAFQRFLVPMRPLSRFPRQAVDRLRRVADAEIAHRFGAWLNDIEVEALQERRRRVLARVDALLESRSSDEVLF